MKCSYCKKEYTAYDEDAGTYKEFFCSRFCESIVEHAIVEENEFNSEFENYHSPAEI